MKTYKAPWSWSLILVSGGITLIAIAIAIYLVRDDYSLVALVPCAIVLGALVFTIRGYTVTPEAILVHRLFWSTRLPLARLESAEVAPEVMRRSMRLWGIGGLFSFAGWFWNKALGIYRAYTTDLHRTVVLRFPGRPVVLSPAMPDQFVSEIRSQRRLA